MEKEAYLKFLQNNCPEAWASYQKGTKLWKTGWGLFGGGLGCALTGGIMCCVAAGRSIDYRTYPEINTESVIFGIGATLFAVGDAAILGSVPCLIIGGLKRNNTHEVYNQYCRRSVTSLTFQLQTSRNGVGIAMNF